MFDRYYPFHEVKFHAFNGLFCLELFRISASSVGQSICIMQISMRTFLPIVYEHERLLNAAGVTVPQACVWRDRGPLDYHWSHCVGVTSPGVRGSKKTF